MDTMENKQYKKLGKDTLIFAISNFSSKILVFLLLPLYTSRLTTAEYGIADLINNIVTILFPILTLSLIEGILRFSFDEGVKRHDILSIALTSVVVSSLILVLCTPIAYLIGNTVWEYWGWVLLVFSGYCLTITTSYYLRGINKTKLVAIQGVVQTALTVTFNIIFLVVLKKGLRGYMMSLVLSYYLAGIFSISYAGIYRDFTQYHINPVLLKEMTGYCLPMIPSKIAWWMNNSLDKYYIIYFCGIGTSGLYSVAHKIPSILSVFTEIFNQAWQISAIEIYNNAEETKKSVYSKVHLYFIEFTVVSSSFLILFAKLIGRILFARDFFTAWRFVPYLILAAVLASISGYYHSIFRAAKHSKELGITVASGTIANVILNSILVPAYGGYGAAIATVIGFFVEWIISYRYATRLVDLSIRLPFIIALFIILSIESVLTISLSQPFVYIVDVAIIVVILFMTRKELTDVIKGIKGFAQSHMARFFEGDELSKK